MNSQIKGLIELRVLCILVVLLTKIADKQIWILKDLLSVIWVVEIEVLHYIELKRSLSSLDTSYNRLWHQIHDYRLSLDQSEYLESGWLS